MINVDTIKMMKLIEDFTERSKNGIVPFSKITSENQDYYISYDEHVKNAGGRSYKVPAGTCLALEHHDVYCYYGDDEDYTMGVVIEEDGQKYVEIKFNNDDIIIIENGEWYFA